MAADVHLPLSEAPVLSTLNADGSRRWLLPRTVHGRLWRARVAVAWGLIALFTLLPWVRIADRPPIHLDVVARRFIFFGAVFNPTDTLPLALLILALFAAIFLLTAIVGRVWCGWACPQTIYLEFVYRPIERLCLGRAWGRKGAKVPAWRLFAMYALFVVISAHLANTFLAYFVGTDRLVGWTLRSPVAHPTAFAIFAVTTGLMLFDFGYFREQLCTLACPYGRFQSVLLDRDSLVVGYDRARGEPRGPIRRGQPRAKGDCVDCSLCVQVCPTGIDIRNGLQMECINCTQCIDACNGVMAKVGREPGLIRYSSQRRFEGTPGVRFRTRLVVYPLLFLAFGGAFVTLLATRADATVVQMRTPGVTFRQRDDGAIESPLRLRVENRLGTRRNFRIESLDSAVALVGGTEVAVGAQDSVEVSLTTAVPRDGFAHGHRTFEVRVVDAEGRTATASCRLLGPLAPSRGEERP